MLEYGLSTGSVGYKGKYFVEPLFSATIDQVVEQVAELMRVLSTRSSRETANVAAVLPVAMRSLRAPLYLPQRRVVGSGRTAADPDKRSHADWGSPSTAIGANLESHPAGVFVGAEIRSSCPRACTTI